MHPLALRNGVPQIIWWSLIAFGILATFYRVYAEVCRERDLARSMCAAAREERDSVHKQLVTALEELQILRHT